MSEEDKKMSERMEPISITESDVRSEFVTLSGLIAAATLGVAISEKVYSKYTSSKVPVLSQINGFQKIIGDKTISRYNISIRNIYHHAIFLESIKLENSNDGELRIFSAKKMMIDQKKEDFELINRLISSGSHIDLILEFSPNVLARQFFKIVIYFAYLAGKERPNDSISLQVSVL